MSRLLFNSDGGSGALFAFEPPITHNQLCRVVNSLQNTQVDVFIQCVSYGSFVVHNTKVGEVYGLNMTDDEFENENFRRWTNNVKGLFDSGKDPLTIWADRTHSIDMQFYASMRMNDIHKDWVERWPSLRSQWERERPYVAIGRDVPPDYKSRNARPGEASDGFTFAFDFAVDEVRNHKLALIDEICSGYEIDGFEMDFLSHPIYFKSGHEREGAPLLTEFMRRVRSTTEQAGKDKGHKLTLLARVPSNVKTCEAIGLDVYSWIEEGLVDALIPTSRGYLNMSRNINEMVEIARGSNCEIYGGLSDLLVRYYRGPDAPRASIEMLRGAAQLHWNAGATAIHLFNYDCHATGVQHHSTEEEVDLENVPLFSPLEYQALTEIGDSQLIKSLNKHYLVMHDMEHRTTEEGGDSPLPVVLEKARDAVEIDFELGDYNSRKTVSVTLIITCDDSYSEWSDIQVDLNDNTLDMQIEGLQLVCNNVPTKKGNNLLRLMWQNSDSKKRNSVRIDGIEFLVNYVNEQ